QISPDGTNGWANVPSNGNNSTYNVPTDVAGTYYYRLLLTDLSNGCQDPISNTLYLVIQPQPTVSISVSNALVCLGGSSIVTSTVVNGSGIFLYQWQSSPDGSSWGNVPSNGNASSYTAPTDVVGTTYYRVLVTDLSSGCSDPVSNTIQVTVQPQPTVEISVDNDLVCVGGSSTLSSVVSNGSGLFNYQWQSSPDGVNGWANLSPNGTNANYSPSNSAPGTTYYRVLVTDLANGCNDPVSNVLSITVRPQPTVTISIDHPAVCVGGTALISSTILNGSGLFNYQWQSSPDGSSGWANITTNGNFATYNVPTLNPGTTYYRLMVTDLANGCSDPLSNVVNIVISPDLVVTSQPQDVNECVGGTNTMSVSVSGGSGTITYQWQSSPDGVGSWTNATGTGSTSSTFTPPSSVAGTTYYRVLVNASNSGCGQTESNVAVAIIAPDIVITIQPTDVNECIGGADQMTVVITGGSGVISYQWQSSPNGTNSWVNASGAGSTTATFTPPSLVAGTTYYRVLVNAANNGCDQVVSNNAVAIISPDIVISSQPTNVNECVGGTSTMTVVVTGGSGTILYQWQSSADGVGGWVNASGGGATTSIFTPPSLIAGTTYYRVLINATNSGCDQATSNVATAVISPDLSFTVQPTDLNECVGGTGTISVTVTGGSGTITYQWQSSPNGSSGWANATGTGATTNTYTPSSTVPGTTYYRVLVNASNSGCGQIESNVVAVEIDPDATIAVAPVFSEACIGGTVLLTATVTGGSNTVDVQWQVLNGTWNDIPGATGVTYSAPTTVSGTTQYRARIVETASGCSVPFSNIVSVVIREDATVTVSVNNSEVCVGGSAVITAVVTGGSSAMTFQWQSSTDNTNWTDIVGANSTSYSAPTNTPGVTYYRIVITDNLSGCSDPVSGSVSVTVVPDATVSLAPVTSEICIGGTSLLTATITGGSSNLTIQWQSNTNGGGWQVVAGATSPTYLVTGTVTGSIQYRVQITDNFSDCSDPLSNTVTVVVQPDATVNVTPLTSEVCVGGTAILTATITGGSTQLTRQWQSSPDGTTGWTNIPGATNAIYSAPTGVAGTTYYRILINDPNSDCSDPVSNAVSVLVQPDATVSIAPLLSNVCVGGSVTLTATITGGSSALTMQWQSSPNGSSGWVSIGGANSSTYNVPTGTAGTTYYRIVITDNFSDCSDPVSENAQVVVAPDLTVTTQPTNVNECVGGTSTMSVVVSGGSGTITYQWQQSANAGGPFSNSTGTGATTSTYTPDSSVPGTTYYRVLV
ncbi:MAG TPA: hypothetical protein VJ508_11380, partial [Saprospiraceae bacterium]|nr:hypothetical protein [Saprospiraceae bacterium]